MSNIFIVLSTPERCRQNKILQPGGKGVILFLTSWWGGRRANGWRSNMIYNGGYYVEFPQWLWMTIEKKELELFYLLNLLKVILVLDLFAEIHKHYVKFALSSLLTFRFQLQWGFQNHIKFKVWWKWIDLCDFCVYCWY